MTLEPFRVLQPLQYLTAVTEGDGLRSEWSERGQWFMSAVAEEDRGSLRVSMPKNPHTRHPLALTKPNLKASLSAEHTGIRNTPYLPLNALHLTKNKTK